MKKYLLFFTLSLTLSTTIYSQKTTNEYYSIKGKIIGLPDTMLFLANHWGDKQFIQDTVRTKNGNFEFKKNRDLVGGIYFITIPGKRYFEILITENKPQFSFTSELNDLYPKMKFKNSTENEIFYDHLTFIETKQKKIAEIKNSKNDSLVIAGKIKEIEKEIITQKEKILEQHPNAFIAKIFKASKDVKVPEAPILSNGRKDSTFQYRYYRQHFFDNIDFSDERMLRTPLFFPKVKYYLEKMVPPSPDSILTAAIMLCEKARPVKGMFRAIVSTLTSEYETSKFIGMDAVFVGLVEKYYMTKEAYWVDDTQLFKINDRARILKPLLLGKQSQGLILKDTSGVFQSLYNVNAKFTILYFWDPDCSHCIVETPKLKEVYDKYKSKGVKVYAASTATEKDKWKKYIIEHKLDWINVADIDLKNNFRSEFDVASTPQIFILDEKKKIILKKIGVEQIPDFFDKYLKL